MRFGYGIVTVSGAPRSVESEVGAGQSGAALVIEKREAAAETVSVTEDSLTVNLADGRTLSVPLAWYPRLLHGSSKERSRCRLIGKGEGIHWPDLDEDISVESLLFGDPSGESQESFKRWLADRKAHPRSSSRRPNPGIQPTRRQTATGG
jgi:hypothetical protein